MPVDDAMVAAHRSLAALPVSEAWLSFDALQALEELPQVERSAAAAGLSSLVVRAAAVHALVLATTDRLDEALDTARRASRMGRTEALPEEEYLAAMVLARVRRLTGRPYLATRILTALASYAPAQWHPWLGWELLMASGGRGPVVLSGVAAELHTALSYLGTGHLASGQRAHWRVSMSDLSARVAGVAPAHRDVRRLHAALDVDAAMHDPTLAVWLSGEQPHAPPFGLSGIEAGSDVAPVAYAVAGPGVKSRRILQRGAALLTDAHVMPPMQRRQARIAGLLAGLALAAPRAVDEAELFRSVYGFKYARNVHKEVLHVGIHRARERLAEHGVIKRDGSMLSLELKQTVLFPDPRCTPLVDDRVLQFVARRGTTTAKDAASALGIPLRSAQGALRELVEGGACKQKREGRRVAYEVEDTTFREPTFVPD